MINKIYSILVIILLFILTALCVLFMRFMPGKSRQIRRIIAKMTKFFVGYKIEFEGRLDENAQMFVLNHQSLLDILIFDEIHPKNTSWVAKIELSKVPLLGAGFVKSGCILIDRKNPQEIVHIIKKAKECVQNDRPVMIFPEGTRNRGNKLLKFQSGAQIVANKLGLRVQPAVIIGTRKIFDSKGLSIHKGTAKVVFLPSFVASENEPWLNETREKMQGILDKNLEFC